MNKWISFTSIFLLSLASLNSCTENNSEKMDEKSNEVVLEITTDYGIDTDSTVHWLTWEQYDSAMQLEPRMAFIDVYTDWCAWCKKMDENLFIDPVSATYINNHFYPIKFDAETKNDVAVNGIVYKSEILGNRSYNAWAKELLNADLQFPALVFLDQNFENISLIQTYQTPSSIKSTLIYIGEEYYKSISWDDFLSSQTDS